MKKLTIMGIVLTAAWLAIFGVISAKLWPTASQMDLNEWGDFLAGLTAPLALLWLIIGYFLQGKELSLNTQALMAQQEELRRQVEETALLAKNSDRQAKAAEKAVELSAAERAAQERDDLQRSRIRIRFAPTLRSSQGMMKATLENIGEDISQVAVSEAASDVKIVRGRMLRSGDTCRFVWPANLPRPMRFMLDYKDSSGRCRREHFEITDHNQLVALGEVSLPDRRSSAS